MSKIIKLTQDKVVKHSVRFTVETPDWNMSIYVPKKVLESLPLPQNGFVNQWPKEIWVNISTEEIK